MNAMSTGLPTFTKLNETFVCGNCGHTVPLATSTCRDHCPRCLFSVHVDNNPGDRAAECGAKLRPVAYSQKKGKGIMIHYRCEACGMEKRNMFLEHDKNESDSLEALLKLSSVTSEERK